MPIRPDSPVWTVAGCAVLASILTLVIVMPPTRQPDVPARAGDLPDQVGAWRGRRIVHCQSEHCMRQYLRDDLASATACPACDAPLGPASLAVQYGLPEDTLIRTLNYAAPFHDASITVTIVISGRQQRSIHRPEQCLPGQGFAIQSSDPLSVALESGRSLAVRLIQARSEHPLHPEILFAYWFRGGDHETNSHLKRLYLMSRDLLVDNVVYPWSYVSVQMAGSREAGDVDILSSFLRTLYPLLK